MRSSEFTSRTILETNTGSSVQDDESAPISGHNQPLCSRVEMMTMDSRTATPYLLCSLPDYFSRLQMIDEMLEKCRKRHQGLIIYT